MWLFLLGLVPTLPLLIGIARFLWPDRKPPGLGARMLKGSGWLALCGLLCVPAQTIWLQLGMTSTSFALKDAAVMMPFSWWVLLGGSSVQQIFEETARAVTGHRQSTLMDNWHYYAALTAVQALVLSLLASFRMGQGRHLRFALRDPWLLVLGAVVLVNGLLGIGWSWWGT